jgi:hypothetical protein
MEEKMSNIFMDLLKRKNKLWPEATMLEIHESGKQGKKFIKEFLSLLINEQVIKNLFFPKMVYNFSSFQEWEDVKEVNWGDSNWKTIFLSGEEGQRFYINFRDWFFQHSHIASEQQGQVEKVMFFDREALEEKPVTLAKIIPITTKAKEVIAEEVIAEEVITEEVIAEEETVKPTTSFLATQNTPVEKFYDRFKAEKEYPWMEIEDWIFAKKSIPEWKDLSYSAMKNLNESSRDFAKAFMSFSTKKLGWNAVGRTAHKHLFNNVPLKIDWDEYKPSIELKIEMEEFALKYVDDYNCFKAWKTAKTLVFHWQNLSRKDFERFNKNTKEFLMLFSIWASENHSDDIVEEKIDELSKVTEDIEVLKKSILAKAFRGKLGTNILEESPTKVWK